MDENVKENIVSIIVSVIFIVIILIGYWYFNGVYRYWDTFRPNTYINDVEVSGKDVHEVIDILRGNDGDAYTLISVIAQEEVVVTLDNMDMQYIDNMGYNLENLREAQSKWKWFMGFLNMDSYYVEEKIVKEDGRAPIVSSKGKKSIVSYSTYDNLKLQSTIEGMQIKKNKSVDAVLVYSEDKNQYIIQNEIYGTEFDNSELCKLIEKAVENGTKRVYIDDICKKPLIYSDDKGLNDLEIRLNKLVNVAITYNFGSRQETLNPNIVKEWVVINEDNISLDIELVKEYIRQLADKYDTFGERREFKTSNGETISLRGGSYGWLMHITKSAEDLISKLLNGQSGLIEPVYSYKALIRESDDIGNSYIEVSLENQHVWVYMDGVLMIDTDCVTGNISKGHNTPTGVYPIIYKQRNATLKGQGYASPVDYWMPFDTNVGLHDATWRNSFGDSIYKTSGSHGCINLPHDKAKEIYQIVYEGMPVIIY